MALTITPSPVITVAKIGRPSADTKLRSTFAAISPGMLHIRIARKSPARAEICASWPVASIKGSPVRRPPCRSTAHATAATAPCAASAALRARHGAAGRVPPRSAPQRRQSARSVPKPRCRKARMTRLAAASSCVPSRATKITSIAWVAICSTPASANGTARRSVAANSDRHVGCCVYGKHKAGPDRRGAWWAKVSIATSCVFAGGCGRRATGGWRGTALRTAERAWQAERHLCLGRRDDSGRRPM